MHTEIRDSGTKELILAMGERTGAVYLPVGSYFKDEQGNVRWVRAVGLEMHEARNGAQKYFTPVVVIYVQ